MTALVSDPGEASKITKGTDTVIYETDLSKEELLQLKQSGEAVVEENFFLFGANENEEPKRPIKGALSDGQDAQESYRELAYKTAVSCQLEWSGEAVDFMPDDQDYLSGFYMRNILSYVIQADKQDYGVKTLTEWFKPIDYRVP